MERLEYNRKILSKLQEVVENNPDLRFGQILRNIEVVKEDLIIKDDIYWKDDFNTESKIIWERMVK